VRVILAGSAGFCYGVKRAVELTKETAAECGGCVMLGDLIHNAHVIAELEALGVRKVAAPEDVREGETVVLRSHGERREVLEALEKRGIRCVSAACPNVQRIQTLAAQAEEAGRQVIIIGEPHHPEILGVASYCTHPLIFGGPDEIRAWLEAEPGRRDTPVTVVAQTTCIRELFETSAKILKKECTNAKIFDTICSATYKRQSEAAEIAGQVDVMVVVGDRRSANTKHLTEICNERCPRVLQIERADELSPDFSMVALLQV